jgi:hypothetical protein
MCAMNERDLVLHGLAIKRHATAAAVADAMGLAHAAVAASLAQAVATNRAVEVNGAFAIAPLAGLALEARYSRHFAALRADTGFARAYETFEHLNRGLKKVITDWQTLDVRGTKIANPHSDKDYDAAVIERLATLHEQIEPVLALLAQRLPRLKSYARKLQAALDAAEDGDTEWVSDIRRDSYHTVWFELHEELLRLMGKVRQE